MTWGFQLVVTFPPGRLPGGEETWTLPDPIGAVSLVVPAVEQPTEIQFRGSGYGSQEAARDAGLLLRWWLRLAGVSTSAAFNFGDDDSASRSFLVEEVRAQAEDKAAIFFVPDVHGLVTFEEVSGRAPRRFSMKGQLTVTLSLEGLRTSLLQAAEEGSVETDRRALACDLTAAADAAPAPSTRLITLVTGTEVMSPRRERTGSSRELLDSFIEQATTEMKASSDADSKSDFETLVNGLRELRWLSITRSVVESTERVRPGDPPSVALVKKAYGCRSELVHGGKTEVERRRDVEDPRRSECSYAPWPARPRHSRGLLLMWHAPQRTHQPVGQRRGLRPGDGVHSLRERIQGSLRPDR